ncbi:carboxypeptidase M32 [Rubinisphaera margarita]|uniref:carboxypeptidase M32 n=1 Tax=Rubinisphaera margarita TaxID=2909586 RepID=UPI001EE9600F|nr:carboxypeptidase M32 [Rubinisphaera margarita]MCG6155491.1 carboxypeptidase M32 [Rubinisphaera margarita]
MNERYAELVSQLQQVGLLGSIGSVLGWEQETYMPGGGAELRSRQISLIAGMAHQRATAPELGELLAELSTQDWGDPHSPEAVNVREARRDYERATKLPQRLVEELSRVTTLSQQAWSQARKKNNFADFQPWLQQVIELKREEARCLQEDGGPLYDTLLDHYEPRMTTAELQATFQPLRDQLVPLVAEIAEAKNRPDTSIPTRSYPVAAQRAFAEEAARAIGFDFDRGRLDESAHPFCSGFGPGDCRLTTRFDDRFFNMAFFGTLHEAGHGIYEQGLNPDAFGLPMGAAVSLGIHESQSRMWENLVGRSRPFWDHFYTRAQHYFPEALGNVKLDDFYRAVNTVEPSFIRVEADEVTYNLHIMLRFELEQMLISGELDAADVPTAWNEKFEAYLGLVPPDDAHGCLQDVHWSAGLIGYFPTYALGNVYASQFFGAAHDQISGLDDLIAKGEFAPLKKWLNENIHQRGQQYSALDLVKVVTNHEFDAEPLVTHLRTKFRDVYRLS